MIARASSCDEGAGELPSLDTNVWSNRRSQERDPCQLKAQVLVDGTTRVCCMIKDISSKGVKIKIDPGVALPKRFSLLIPVLDEVDEARACELRWRVEDVAGVRFLEEDAIAK